MALLKLSSRDCQMHEVSDQDAQAHFMVLRAVKAEPRRRLCRENPLSA